MTSHFDRERLFAKISQSDRETAIVGDRLVDESINLRTYVRNIFDAITRIPTTNWLMLERTRALIPTIGSLSPRSRGSNGLVPVSARPARFSDRRAKARTHARVLARRENLAKKGTRGGAGTSGEVQRDEGGNAGRSLGCGIRYPGEDIWQSFNN